MTKKHFEAIAEAIARTIILTDNNGTIRTDYLVDELAETFKIANPDFNAKKFNDYIIEQVAKAKENKIQRELHKNNPHNLTDKYLKDFLK